MFVDGFARARLRGVASGESKTRLGVGGGGLVLVKTGRKVCESWKVEGRREVLPGVIREGRPSEKESASRAERRRSGERGGAGG